MVWLTICNTVWSNPYSKGCCLSKSSLENLPQMISLGLKGFPPSTHLTNQHSISLQKLLQNHIPKGFTLNISPESLCWILLMIIIIIIMMISYVYFLYGIIQKILLSFVFRFSFTYLPKHTPEKHSLELFHNKISTWGEMK